MSDESANILVRLPQLYERIFPEAGNETAEVCMKLISKFGPGGSLKILDAGSGTAKILSRLDELGHQCVGIDMSEPMVEYARVLYPQLRIELADMRTFSMDEQFDVVLCLGSTFTYNLTNKDVHTTLENFRRHCADGGLLILDILNASRFLSSEVFRERIETQVSEGDFSALAISRHLLDRHRQCFRRIRTWQVDGEEKPVVDDAAYRLFFPLELEDYLSQHRFSILGMWDNKFLQDSEFSGRRLYTAARAY